LWCPLGIGVFRGGFAPLDREIAPPKNYFRLLEYILH